MKKDVIVCGFLMVAGFTGMVTSQQLYFTMANLSGCGVNKGPYLRGSGGSGSQKLYLVASINSSATNLFNRITNCSSGQGPGFIFEDTNLVLKIINLGLTAGFVDTIPFIAPVPGSGTLEDIPLRIEVASAGTGTNPYFLITTWGTPATNLPKPSFSGAPVNQVVTHLCGISGSCTAPNYNDNSPKVIDRFWLIHPENFTTKPIMNYEFHYRDAEWSAGGNSIAEANLQAQRWNPNLKSWYDMPPAGTVNTTANYVSVINILPANLFSFWTLVDNSLPLPIIYPQVDAFCSTDGTVIIKCSCNNPSLIEKYRIEISRDGANYTAIASIIPTGQNTVYELRDVVLPVYVRVIAEGTDKSEIPSETRYIESCMNTYSVDVYSFDQENVRVVIKGAPAGTYSIYLYDNKGKLILSDNLFVNSPYFEKSYNLSDRLASATYRGILISPDNSIKNANIYIKSW